MDGINLYPVVREEQGAYGSKHVVRRKLLELSTVQEGMVF